MTNIVITAAKRTPVGSFLGAYANTPAHELGRIAIEAALAQSSLSAQEIDEVILGQVLTAAQGQNPTRQAAINAGMPKERTAFTINQVCGSGLRAVALAAQAIQTGDARIVHGRRPGEACRMSPHALLPARRLQKMGDASLVDTMIFDGLTDVFNGYHMGHHRRERRRSNIQITREEQDEFAVASQNKAEAAQKCRQVRGRDRALHVKGRKGDVVVDRTNISATAPRWRRCRS
jgi:acetyl-CoA C-acetyltransferase